MLKIPSKILLGLYLVIPVCILIVFFDMFFLSDFLKKSLRADPESYRIVTIFLFYPHVLMSLATLLNREYLSNYKKEIISWRILPYIATIFIGYLWEIEIFYILFSYLSSKHLLGQQMGVERLFGNDKDKKARTSYSYNLYIIIATIVYYRIAFPNSQILGQYFELGILNGYKLLGISMLFIFLFLDARRIYIKTQSKRAQLFIWGNFSLIVSAMWFLQTDYIFFAFFVPRFIHDLTAIVFYIVHDKNKMTKGASVLILPLICLLISNILIQIKWAPIEIMLFCLGLFHFYIESFIWKKGSKHRENILVT